MNKMSSTLPDPVPFRVTDPERIPSRRYYEEAFFEAEREHLWSRVWQMACRLEEIPELGDFTEYRNLDQSVIVVRTKEGVKAFANACRHRGVQLVSGNGNCKDKGFICPFHGWRWNAEGKCTFVFSRQMFSEHNLDAEDTNLVPVRCETWGGCAFINLDDDAPPLAECVKPVAQIMDARNVSQMKVEWWRSTVLPTNWKLAMEAFMEGYHVMRTHPQLHQVSIPGTDIYGSDTGKGPARTNTGKDFADVTIHHLHLLREGMGGMIHAKDMVIAEELRDLDVPEDIPAARIAWYTKLHEEITKRARAEGVPMPDLNAAAANYSPVEFIFPHYFMLPMFGNMASYRIRPLTPETCLFEMWTLSLYPDEAHQGRLTAPEPGTHLDDDVPPIPKQDYGNLPLQQLGLHAKGFEYMRLSKEIEGLISNYQRLIDGFIEGADRDRLVAAIQAVNGRYEAPVKPLDL